jgi:methionine aminopeptidase
LAEGDLVKLDVTIEKNGFMADTAATVAVGAISHERQRLVECAERAFNKAMLVARAGFRIFEIVLEKLLNIRVPTVIDEHRCSKSEQSSQLHAVTGY